MRAHGITSFEIEQFRLRAEARSMSPVQALIAVRLSWAAVDWVSGRWVGDKRCPLAGENC